MDEFIVKIPEQHPMTDDELFALCVANKELRIERDEEGQLIIMSPTGGVTGDLNFKLTGIFGRWADDHSDLGYGFDSASAFRLRDKSMRSPDVTWIRKDRWESLPLEDREKIPSVCPDFAIELRSKSDSINQLKSKMAIWIKNGCQLAWLIDPVEEKVSIYTHHDEVIELNGFDKKISAANLFPRFELNLSKLK